MKNPFELGWSMWKKGFDAWDQASTSLLDTWMKSPALLGPAGSMLASMTKLQAQQRQLMSLWWGGLGLSTRDDQERVLHALHEVQSQLLDLEDRLAEAEAARRDEGGR
ncbi:MAG: hypothetical protein KF901_15910 [Myxococcales bacterium]|nr:hypothetical protein [Myxococcales bacterium]